MFEQYSRNVQRRRHTISTFDEAVREERVRTTAGGRRKKQMAPGLTAFLSLTTAQAQVRKWLYALFVYIASLLIIIGPIRKYVAERALQGQDPFGWAIGYMFGNFSNVRFWVLMLNLEYWIELPPRPDEDVLSASCFLGSIEHIRQTTFGAASTRLLLSGYCVVVLLTGLAVVIQLSSIAEVDTRRKIFHGMMVLMFLPAIFVDPAFCALALALALSVFLLLDLFRASQLPPISRPLTYFLAPYVDGRDHRGPVIISHIFLLIGCSIPLWLSISDLPRTGLGPWAGWEIPSRDVSMASGVICVGMGDAAASLIGRRFGRLKWFWGGGKSLEGSVAFAAAVTCGLIAVRAWLVLGGWPVSGVDGAEAQGAFSIQFWLWTLCKAVLAAAGTSATEAILTGCNDNVVVPVVLWLLVRGLGV
jgi:dolichol kinase